jgi:mannose/fructose/N-acetylgalactosamine-specific phosphotransferase system component IIC
MHGLSLSTLATLLGWGTLVGMDLVSVPQMMIARPLVAGSVAGLILGDPEAGLRVGVLMELFALDVLAVGAVRYPDYGPATVAAVLAAVGQRWQVALGPAVAVALLTAAAGGWSMRFIRHANARSIQARSAALSAGESTAIRTLQYLGLARDLARSVLLTTLGLLLARLASPLVGPRLWPMALAAIAVGLAAVLDGALRSAGQGKRLYWLAAGLTAGTLWVLIR